MKKIQEIAAKYKVSEQTVRTLLEGLKASGGRQVQFNISELGGMGQWQGGMVMIGDMFNNSLKAKVAELCSELAPLSQTLAEEDKKQESTVVETDRKPADKRPSASFSGSQNGHKYAYYASEHMLEMEENGHVTKYSTEGYALSGVQQLQDNGGRSLRFSYPGGTVSVNDLKKAE